ncbi:MAG: hypothetical protein JWL59_1412 [Chthoniobacteraceae bacterium]|nr:hypothetical protein [Chthoniobacteraceae bacterium]
MSIKTVVVLGATPKSDRFAYRAMEMLRQHGHRPLPVNPAFAEILGVACYKSISDISEPVDTVTLYLSAPRSEPLIGEIVAAKPKRIIFNPGAENEHLERDARLAGIEVVHGCTLVMLQSGTF